MSAIIEPTVSSEMSMMEEDASDSGSFVSSSFNLSGDDTEEEEEGMSARQLPPPPLLEPLKRATLPAMPFLPLVGISSYLSFADRKSLYYTHRALRETIDGAALSFFGPFYDETKRGWMKRAKEAHGWSLEGHEGDTEFWNQIKAAFWVSSFPWDRNDHGMIEHSFWLQGFDQMSSPDPLQGRRFAQSAGYRAFTAHGYILSGFHHIALLQNEICYSCLFFPERESAGPMITTVRSRRQRAFVVDHSQPEAAEERGPSVPSSSVSGKRVTCDSCGVLTCGRHSTSAETDRSLALELAVIEHERELAGTPPPPVLHLPFQGQAHLAAGPTFLAAGTLPLPHPHPPPPAPINGGLPQATAVLQPIFPAPFPTFPGNLFMPHIIGHPPPTARVSSRHTLAEAAAADGSNDLQIWRRRQRRTTTWQAAREPFTAYDGSVIGQGPIVVHELQGPAPWSQIDPWLVRGTPLHSELEICAFCTTFLNCFDTV